MMRILHGHYLLVYTTSLFRFLARFHTTPSAAADALFDDIHTPLQFTSFNAMSALISRHLKNR